jgi:hypothetical protein
MKTLDIPRTSDNVQFNIDILNKLGVDFEVQHGTYTTTIITEEGKSRYMMNTYNNRVFRCASMIKSDVLKSDNAKEIMASKYLKNNFGVSQNKNSFHAKQVLNIDISSAYATCLVRNGLISEKTYGIIKKLPKTERLPCVGMLATSHTKFYYSNGECYNVDVYRAPTASVFFYLIDEINYIMQEIQFLLGVDFIFYWVDGIFFNYNTAPEKIQMIENFLIESGYTYKYEDVQDFKMDIDDKKMMLKMIKNNEPKQYIVGKDDVGESVKTYLNDMLKKQTIQPNINQIK